MIEKGKSPWISPIVMVPKKGSKLGEYLPRMCVDYRQLNKVTVKDRQPLPNIGVMLNQLKDARYFSTLDLFSGYYQIGMSREAKIKAAFITPEATYLPIQMPFGLCNVPPSFQ